LRAVPLPDFAAIAKQATELRRVDRVAVEDQVTLVEGEAKGSIEQVAAHPASTTGRAADE
jgi:hypothetical protein